MAGVQHLPEAKERNNITPISLHDSMIADLFSPCDNKQQERDLKSPIYEIKSGLDPNKLRIKRPIGSKYGFAKMAVGQYFEVPGGERNAVARAASVYGAMNAKVFSVKRSPSPRRRSSSV